MPILDPLMLHITPGDSARDALTRAELDGEILPWRDILHEGPVPVGLTLEKLSSVRAAFIASCGWGDLDEVQAQFDERDFRLSGAGAEDEVVLWCESDLFDQLQLLQLLDWFADDTHRPGRISVVYTDRLPRTGELEGLGRNPPQRIHELFDGRTPFRGSQFDLGRRAWAAFRARTPSDLAALLAADLSPLPYLSDALLRLMQDLPALSGGLSRTERMALELAAEKPRSPAALFAAVSRQEPRPWLGDWPFWRMLNRLGGGQVPLLEADDGKALELPPRADARATAWTRVQPTAAGRAVLAGEADAIELNGIDRWLGGTRLWRGGEIWRWNAAGNALVAPNYSASTRSDG